MRAEGRRKPDMGCVAGARTCRLFNATIFEGNAAIIPPLAAVVIAIHVRRRLDAHARDAARAGPRDR